MVMPHRLVEDISVTTPVLAYYFAVDVEDFENSLLGIREVVLYTEKGMYIYMVSLNNFELYTAMVNIVIVTERGNIKR